MNNVFSQLPSAIFLGLADHYDAGLQPFPFGGVDIFQMSRHKQHIVYPGIISSNQWVVLLSHSFLRTADLKNFGIRVLTEDKKELGSIRFSGVEIKTGTTTNPPNNKEENIIVFRAEGNEYSLFHFRIDTTIPKPGRYIVETTYQEETHEIGIMEFHYKKAPPLTPDQIMAIKSDADAANAIMMNFSCKLCSSEMKTYVGIERSEEFENNGFIWHSNLTENFTCSCGKTAFSLQYVKESMHALLLKDFPLEASGISYVRKYGHQQIQKIVKDFYELVKKESLEQPVQTFIENNPVLLSRFAAKRLYAKPDIVGRFQADFAILDTKNQLWLIELEKPSLQLFKKDGHPSSFLMHAYEQVNDWLQQQSKYPGAILEGLGLESKDVVAIRGAVIAGRKHSVTTSQLQRLLLNPPYSRIEFMTIDELGDSLLAISRKLL